MKSFNRIAVAFVAVVTVVMSSNVWAGETGTLGQKDEASCERISKRNTSGTLGASSSGSKEEKTEAGSADLTKPKAE